MGTEGDTDRGRLFGFETQHIFALAIASLGTDAAEAAEALLASIGFNLEGIDNKIALLIDPTTRDAVLNGPPDIAVAFVECIPRGFHPPYKTTNWM